ncbi:MAG TPA: S8 family peptidase [Gemmataceae bacterium]|nr:S8 family peptidase [Gemmataceae bacterium]
MRLRLLALFLLSALAPALATADQPPPPGAEPPVVVLPPDEREPLKIFRIEADGLDWGVGKLNCVEAHKTTKGKGVRVANLDTGVDASHPDLKDAIADAADLKNFTSSRLGFLDKQGHGTHTIGRMLARGPNHGVAPEAALIVGKVLGDDGSGSVTWIAAGIRWADVERNADVISLSLGGPSADSYIPKAAMEAESHGVILIAAAGNEGPNPNTVGYPGGYNQFVAVGATDINNAVARFSSRGPAVFVSAPGVNIRSQYPGGQYATMSGTSMACPHVAGLAALWVAANPDVPKKERPAKFRAALQAACADLGPVGRDTAYGWGFPDAAKLVIQVAPPPKDKFPRTIEFGPGDFTPSGLEKLKRLGVEGFSFTLKP